jgi:hypothetical protein
MNKLANPEFLNFNCFIPKLYINNIIWRFLVNILFFLLLLLDHITSHCSEYIIIKPDRCNFLPLWTKRQNEEENVRAISSCILQTAFPMPSAQATEKLELFFTFQRGRRQNSFSLLKLRRQKVNHAGIKTTQFLRTTKKAFVC